MHHFSKEGTLDEHICFVGVYIFLTQLDIMRGPGLQTVQSVGKEDSASLQIGHVNTKSSEVWLEIIKLSCHIFFSVMVHILYLQWTQGLWFGTYRQLLRSLQSTAVSQLVFFKKVCIFRENAMSE